MRVCNIKPPIYEQKYRPNPEINFKCSGVGIVLGWTAGTIGGVAVSTKKAIEEEVVLPNFIDSLIVLLSGLTGGFLGYCVEKMFKK